MSGHISAFAQGTQIDFNTIPKSGTALMYAHLDDDLIWMLPFWKITEKFIGGNEPKTPAYEAIIHEQQVYLNNNGYNINYESNWMTPWGILTNNEYRGYYDSNAPEYQYLAVDHLLSYWDNNDDQLVRKEINKIKAKIEQYIASLDVSRVITHDNWGEYGHQHHKALNKAVRELAVKYRKDVWMLGSQVVSGNFTDVTVPTGITYTLGSFNDPALYSAIRTIYQNNGRWTYVYDQIPSGDHKFIKIVDGGIDKSNILTGESVTTSGSYQNEPGAYIFDGEDDYLTLQGNNNSSFTIAMRIRPDLIRAMDISAMSEYPLSTTNDRNFYLTADGHVTARIFDGSAKTVISSSVISAGTWTHIAMTCNGSTFKIYVNGLLENTISAGTAITYYSTPEFVLGQATRTAGFFKGQINNVNLYNRALSDNEVAQLSGKSYTITSSAGPGGSISPSGSVAARVGSEITFNISANSGYQIADVLVDNSSVGAVSSYKFSNINNDHKISASFKPKTYSITVVTNPGGKISPGGVVTINNGAKQVFTIKPDDGYGISDVKVDNVSVGTVTSYTLNNITSNHSISATFMQLKRTVNASASKGGKIVPEGIVSVNYGTNKTFAINADEGYKISDVTVDNTSVGPVSSYTFNNIISNHTISASFSLITYNIESSSGLNGTISPSGIIRPSHGTDLSFTIEANNGYQVEDVKVDKVSLGPLSKYTFINIKSDHTISVTFKPLTYNLTGNAGSHGTINPTGLVTVIYGDDLNYMITPDQGYQIADVLIDNTSMGVTSNYKFRDITTDHTISVEFKPITFTITSLSNSGGSINPEGDVKVIYGNDQHYTIIPDYGYKFFNLMVDFHPVYITSNDYSFTDVTHDHTIAATFLKMMTFALKAGKCKNGSISPRGDTIVFEGSNQTYTITPVPGFRIANVMIDTLLVGPVSEYTFSDIYADHSISALFSSSVEPDIYPNPFKQEFKINIRSPYDYNYDISIITLGNRVVYMNPEIPANTTIAVTPEISPGFYILNVYYKGKKAASVRIIKY
jgi:hypothetical protein